MIPPVATHPCSSKLKLSVIIPVFDEANTITTLVPHVARVATSLAPGAAEVLVIDDGNPKPLPTQFASGVNSCPVYVLRRKIRGGSGAARKTGLKYAKGEWIAWIDGDGTYAPEDLATLWNVREPYDQVIGLRNCDYGQLRIVRIAVKRLACSLAERRWKRTLPDLNSGLRIFRRDAANAWSDELPDGFSCATTATLAALAHNQALGFIPIRYLARPQGTRSKFHPIRDTFRLFRVIRRWQPHS